MNVVWLRYQPTDPRQIVFGSQESLLGADKSGPTLISESRSGTTLLSVMLMLGSAWTACTTAADILIAGGILWGLYKSKSGYVLPVVSKAKLTLASCEVGLTRTR